MKRPIDTKVEVLNIDMTARRARFKIMTPGMGNGLMFPMEVLIAAANMGMFEGIKAFIDHRDLGIPKPNLQNPNNRNLQNIAGLWMNTSWNGESLAVEGDFVMSFTKNNAFLWDLIQFQSEANESDRFLQQVFGVSAVIQFSSGFEDKIPTVRRILRVFSADFVTDPARGGELITKLSTEGYEMQGFEVDSTRETVASLEKNGDMTMPDEDFKNLITENVEVKSQLKAKDGDIEKLGKDVSSRDDQIKTLQEDNAKKETAIKSMQFDQKVDSILAEKLKNQPEPLVAKVKAQLLVLSNNGVDLTDAKIDEICKQERDYYDSVRKDTNGDKSTTPAKNGSPLLQTALASGEIEEKQLKGGTN